MYSLHKIFVCLSVFFLPLTASGYNPYRMITGAEEAGMGSLSLYSKSFWSSFNNQALLAEKNSIVAAINYQDRFCLSQLATKSAGLIIPSGSGSAGLIFSHFGYKEFSRTMTGLACGLHLSEKISAGIQIDYFSEKAPGEFQHHHSVTFETGFFIKIRENIFASLHMFNPLPDALRKRNMPSTITTGAGIQLNKAFFAALETEMCSSERPVLKTGFTYELTDNLCLQGGFNTRNCSFSFGTGLTIKNIYLNMSISTHEKLGLSHFLSLVFKT